MKSTDASVAAAFLRGITDEIASHCQPATGKESIPELIGRVREVSTQAQTQMRSALGAALPQIGWSDSEDKYDREAGEAPYWVYDPVDGAYHYLQGLPLWSSSLALVKDGRAVMALVYEPSQRELFIAEAGTATTLNGRSVTTSAKADLRAAVVGMAVPPYGSVAAKEHELAAKLLVETSRHVFVTRQMAAASLQLAYIACGRLDAYIEVGTDIYDWMAGALLVQQAGGIVSALDGDPFGIDATGIVAAAPHLHVALQRCVAAVTHQVV
jgi:myo-inositol-1(or 4)-monophosphatase